MVKKVTIDYDVLNDYIKSRGKAKEEFSTELGRGKTYISDMRKRPEINDSMERLMCVLLDIEPGSLVKKENVSGAEVKMFENLFKKMCELEEIIVVQGEMMEKLIGKANANTVQLEKIKDRLKYCTKSDYEKACDFLRDILSDGRVIGDEVLLKSDAHGIKRADLMKAKRELNVDQATTGYGKNQKTWWFIPS